MTVETVPQGQMCRLDLLLTPECKSLLDLARPEGQNRMVFLENIIWDHPAIEECATKHEIKRRSRAKEGRAPKSGG